MSDALHTVVVARKAIEAHNMASFELVPADDQPLPGFTPGSHIDVTLPNGLTRQYSLLNSASERNRYCIGVWKDGNSRGGSKALHLDINEGDRLQVSRPRNRFKIPKDTKRALLVARGIGVTPILSIADTLKAAYAWNYRMAAAAGGALPAAQMSSVMDKQIAMIAEGWKPR